MKFNDCPECHTELSEYACSLHRVAPVLLAALKGLTLLRTIRDGPHAGAVIVGPQGWHQAQDAIAKAEEGS